MYEIFARVYDGALAEGYEPLVRAELTRALEAHGPPPGKRVLDAGCGTGILACSLAREGWKVTGLDLSAAMLGKARDRAASEGVEVEWVEGDMRRFRREEGFDLVVSCYDALNHLMTNADLMRTLRSFHASLAEEGLLAFDVSNRLAYWLVWSDPEPYTAQVGKAQVSIHTTFDKANRVGEARVRILEGDRMEEETLRQRFFSDTEVEGLLLAEGFEVLDRRDFRGVPEDLEVPLPEGEEETRGKRTGLWKDHDDPERLKTFWICRKRRL